MHKYMHLVRGIASSRIHRQVSELQRYCRTMDESNLLQLALNYDRQPDETKRLVEDNIVVLLARKNGQDRYGK